MSDANSNTGSGSGASPANDVANGSANQGQPIVRARGLTVGFGAKNIHENLDLDIYRGEVLGVVGGSGTGK